MRVDLHMHTGYSADAQYPQSIDDKIHACEQAGLDIIGITDHLDFLRSGGTRDNRDPEACALIRQNRAKFAVANLYLTEGRAPAALMGLPAPDAVFIGGSRGSMRQIVDAVLAANPAARLCISAIALETLQEAVAALTAHGLTAQVTQIAVSRSKQAGALHLLMANNPVFLIVRE